MLRMVTPTISKLTGTNDAASGALLNATNIALGLPRLDAYDIPKPGGVANETLWNTAVALGPPLCRLTARPTTTSFLNGPPPAVHDAPVVSWLVIAVQALPS